MASQYLSSFYFIIYTMMTVGYGDQHADPLSRKARTNTGNASPPQRRRERKRDKDVAGRAGGGKGCTHSNVNTEYVSRGGVQLHRAFEKAWLLVTHGGEAFNAATVGS